MPGMNTFQKFAVIVTAALLPAALLSGCATGMGKDECALADWRTVGYEDGLRGFPAERIGAHRVACAKHQVAPDLAAYTEGRQRGLVEFCQPKNGFHVGLHGGVYANVCSGPTEQAFVNGYQWGRQIHMARSELNSTQSQLRSARSGLAKADSAIASATAELLLPHVPKERRIYLAQELVQLGQDRIEFATRIEQLTVRSQQLALNVQRLEQQSPYPL